MKSVQCYRLGDEDIPNNAKFLHMRLDENLEEIFYYEVSERASSSSGSIINPSDIDFVIKYLNDKTGGKYSLKTEKTRDLIRRWMKQGKTKDDFKDVIDKKNEEWGNDPHWSQYLRPQTLFGPKFESYQSKKSADELSNSAFDELDVYLGRN